MKNMRGVLKAQRQYSDEAKQCQQCARWFTDRRGNRVLCFRCEEGQGIGSQ
jgi:hypothetical protein